MDILDEISYLSEVAYRQMEVGNYSAAKTYFINAASLIIEKSKGMPVGDRLEVQSVAKSLLGLARNAHDLSFKQMETSYLEPVISNGKSTDQILLDKRAEELENQLQKLPDAAELDQETKINIPLGRYIESKNIITWKPDTLMNGIFTVTGGSGSGKSELLKSLATELIHNGLPVCILDLHGDLNIPGIKSISLDYRGNHSVNPMELTSLSQVDGGPAPHINRLLNQFSYAISDRFSATQKSWLRNLLNFVYEQKGFYQGAPENWQNDPPTFDDLLEVIKYPEEVIIQSHKNEYIRLLDTVTNSTMMAVENRLIPILEHPAFSGQNSIPIEEIVHQPLRIELKPLNTIDNQFLAADTIIRQIFAYLKSMGHMDDEDCKFRLFIMIDEVKILTGIRGKLNDPYHILNRLATEARKFGLGLILASQILGHFGRDIRSNAASKVILRTMDLDETKRCAKEFKLTLRDLRELSRPGEGFISTSRAPEAQHIQLFPSDVHPIKNIKK